MSTADILQGFHTANILKDSFPKISLPSIGTIEPPRNYNLADYTREIILKEIKSFEDTLDDEHEIGIRLTSFGQSMLMRVTDIGYANPSTLLFHGFVNDQRSTLIQHVSQLNFLLVAVPKAEPEKPPLRIGFSLPTED